jgi:hypothetical protein
MHGWSFDISVRQSHTKQHIHDMGLHGGQDSARAALVLN